MTVTAAVAEIANQGACLQLGDETFDDAVIDCLRRNPVEGRPGGKTRQTTTCPWVGACQPPAPSAVEFDAKGPQHRLDARLGDRSRKVAAQVRPSLIGYLCLCGHHSVERLADVGKVKPDRRRGLPSQLGEAGAPARTGIVLFFAV
jgi:hypothetical protein